MQDKSFHKLIRRQLKRHLDAGVPVDSLHSLLAAVSEAYLDFDNERALLERSLELVSEELNQRNLELRRKLGQLEQTHIELGHSMAVLDSIFDATGEVILAFDQQGHLVQHNRAAQDFLQIDQLATLRTRKRALFKLLNSMKNNSEFKLRLAKLRRDPYEALFGTTELKDGRLLEYHTSPQLTGKILSGRVWCIRDVTTVKENEALIQFQAYHDALTKLPNRVLLLDRIKHAIAQSKRCDSLLAVLFIDLDHFKKVNDTVGHQVGDLLLVEVSERIRACLRDHDTLARFGGDEFVVVLENIQSHQIAIRACQRIIQQVLAPFKIGGKVFHISTSIGISVYPRDDLNAEELIRKADLAMYHAKDNGRGLFEFFNPSLERIANHQLDLENKLRLALKNQELVVYYQPQVETCRLRTNRMEALLRWFPPSGAAVSPADFIPVAERAGLIIEIGRWVLLQVCAQIRQWRSQGFNNICVSVNLSAQQFSDTNLLNEVKNMIREYDIDGHNLEFEITESILMENMEQVSRVLQAFRDLGISVAIDDFGTGYSSLKYLQKLPIDSVKIDRSFINELAAHPNDQSIVNAIISLGHNLNLTVVAEGVETKTVVEFLRQRQCDFIQGFYFHKPMPSEAITLLLLNDVED